METFRAVDNSYGYNRDEKVYLIREVWNFSEFLSLINVICK